MGSSDWMLFLALCLAAFSVYSITALIFTGHNEQAMLSWASGSEPVKSKSPIVQMSRGLVHQFTLHHAVKIKNPAYRKNIDHLILTAGLGSELNVDEFIGLQILWGGVLPIFLIIMNFALQMDLPLIALVLAIPAGVYFPFFYARQQKSERESSIRSDLPFFVELLALSTIGLDLITAIKRISEKASGTALTEELQKVIRDINLGATRAKALKDMARRVDIPEMLSFTSIVIDADATGASISQVLKDQSTQMRLERFVRAEKAGARASQIMLIPMLLFILPAVFLVVFGPVIIQFFSGGGTP